jgi:hypothetical protein
MIPDLDTLRSMTPTNVAGSQSRKRPRKKKWSRGQHNPLERLISDKGIQGNASLFL